VAGSRSRAPGLRLSEARRSRFTGRQSRPPDLVVIEPLKEFTCTGCGGTGPYLIMEDSGPLCLACADPDHLVFLPAGNAALSRRAKSGSDLSAVVVARDRVSATIDGVLDARRAAR
jgi:hypothetical protein